MWGNPSFAKAPEWLYWSVYYSYILLSSKSHIFYYGYTSDLSNRFNLHNTGKVFSTKAYIPWKLVWYGSFDSEQEAKDFEQYLKSGSGKAFAYKRLVSEVLKKDVKARQNLRCSIAEGEGHHVG